MNATPTPFDRLEAKAGKALGEATEGRLAALGLKLKPKPASISHI